jgi:hypothetical protein
MHEDLAIGKSRNPLEFYETMIVSKGDSGGNGYQKALTMIY